MLRMISISVECAAIRKGRDQPGIKRSIKVQNIAAYIKRIDLRYNTDERPQSIDMRPPGVITDLGPIFPANDVG